MLFSAQASAATFVYVSSAEDGDIGLYTLQPDGSLQPGARFKAEKVVMPMTVSPDKRFLIAGVRSKPFSAYTYSIDRRSGDRCCRDRKSTRLNSSHVRISYAVFCLKKKKKHENNINVRRWIAVNRECKFVPDN